MKKFLFGVLLLPAVVLAQQPVVVEKPVVCSPTKEVVSFIMSEDYKEIPVWIGEDEDSKYSIFANEKTGTWTFIQFNKKIACVLGAGYRHKSLASL